MKCTRCGHEMIQNEGIYNYRESGLEKVMLVNIPMYRCPSCKETEVEIPHVEELHLLIGFLLALKPIPLKGDEARFLRKNLGYTAEELASLLGVTRVTVSRWETGKPLQRSHDKHLRRLYFDKKKDELKQLPAVNKILSVLLDNAPLLPEKQELRIRTEDWAGETVAVKMILTP